MNENSVSLQMNGRIYKYITSCKFGLAATPSFSGCGGKKGETLLSIIGIHIHGSRMKSEVN